MNLSADIALRFPAAVAGVAIGRLSDKATWRIDYAPNATAQQKDEVAAYLAAIDVAAFAGAGRISDARKRVVAFADSLAEQITGPVPAAEKLGWDKKEAAARAHVAGLATAAQAALLQGEYEAAGVDDNLDALAATIIAKADFYAVAVARIAGTRRKTMAALDALGATPTQEAIEATLATAKAAAEADLAGLMASVSA